MEVMVNGLGKNVLKDESDEFDRILMQQRQIKAQEIARRISNYLTCNFSKKNRKHNVTVLVESYRDLLKNMKEEKLELKAKYSAPGDSAEITDVSQEKFLSKRCIDVDLNVTTADMPMGISKLIEIFNNQLVEIKQYEPTEPTNPAEPSEPAEPTEPALPTAPTEPIAPAEPEKPIAPAEPIEPEKPEPNYNIQLLTKVSKSQKADIINAINSTNRTGKPITAAALNNILKSEKKTIPIETTQATAKAIVQTLKRKNIAAIMVEV